MQRYLAAHPDSARWWVELAWDEYLAGNADSALASLERLRTVRPDYNSADRELLLARCALEKDDSLGFQEMYKEALDIAVERDEHTARLRRDRGHSDQTSRPTLGRMQDKPG